MKTADIIAKMALSPGSGRIKISVGIKKWSEGNGTGALQLAVRYSELDLNDSGAGIAGGEQKSLTLGLNWELNPMSRIMYNFVHAKFSDGTGADSGKLISNLVRFQVDF